MTDTTDKFDSQTLSQRYPDLAGHGYRIEGELGRNALGGRSTYRAIHLSSEERVVLKQFEFAQDASDWSGYQTHYDEIKVLRRLDHPGIPRYIDSFETSTGFCMVQQYIAAESLARPRRWQPEAVKQVALNLLDILVYLQARHSPVIRRDIKPENVLVDDQLNTYLVDFGFARINQGRVADSSMVKGQKRPKLRFGIIYP